MSSILEKVSRGAAELAAIPRTTIMPNKNPITMSFRLKRFILTSRSLFKAISEWTLPRVQLNSTSVYTGFPEKERALLPGIGNRRLESENYH
jgi:hypothetical protein